MLKTDLQQKLIRNILHLLRECNTYVPKTSKRLVVKDTQYKADKRFVHKWGNIHPKTALLTFFVCRGRFWATRMRGTFGNCGTSAHQVGESSDSSSMHNFEGGDCECKQTLCLSRRSRIRPKLSTRCILNAQSKGSKEILTIAFLLTA